MPFPLVEIFRGGQGSGANALTGIENIQSIVRAIAGGGGIDSHAEEHGVVAVLFKNPRILHTFEAKVSSGEQALGVGGIQIRDGVGGINGGAPAAVLGGYVACEISDAAIGGAAEGALLDRRGFVSVLVHAPNILEGFEIGRLGDARFTTAIRFHAAWSSDAVANVTSLIGVVPDPTGRASPVALFVAYGFTDDVAVEGGRHWLDVCSLDCNRFSFADGFLGGYGQQRAVDRVGHGG